MAKKKYEPYKSGICAFSNLHHKCLGEFKSGALAETDSVRCHCDCHKTKGGNVPVS